MPEQNWNEHRTRKQYIDKLLIGSKWGPIVEFKEGKNYVHGSVEEYPTRTGPCKTRENWRKLVSELDKSL